MSATSIAVGVMDLYDAIPAAEFPGATRPAMYLDEAPPANGSAAQVNPGTYLVLKGGNYQPVHDSSFGGYQSGTVTVEVYSASAVTCGQVALAARYGGDPPASRSGLDFGTLSLANPLSAVSLVPAGNTDPQFAGLNKDGATVYRIILTYRVVARVLATY